ncbi:MAG: GNAT family N-acetyltransferase [Actinomycetota bacterium]|nr:GNAT family N-acetyltransferase [Actinomycetota bacterium]
MNTPDDLVFETERTWVRQWRDQDAARVLDIHSRWDIVRWLDDDPSVLRDLDQARQKIRRWRELTREGSVIGQWAVQDKATGIVVGGTNLLTLPRLNREVTDEVHVGWTLHPDSQGRGYAREAAAGALVYGFAHGLTEIRALMFTDNVASARVALALGMDDLGVLTDHWYVGESRVFRTTADSLDRAPVR